MRFKCNPLILLLLLPLFSSCVNNADFDQINLDVEPRVVFPLVFFELNQLDFIDDVTNAELTFVSDVTDVEVFQSSTIRDNLEADIEGALGVGMNVIHYNSDNLSNIPQNITSVNHLLEIKQYL